MAIPEIAALDHLHDMGGAIPFAQEPPARFEGGALHPPGVTNLTCQLGDEPDWQAVAALCLQLVGKDAAQIFLAYSGWYWCWDQRAPKSEKACTVHGGDLDNTEIGK